MQAVRDANRRPSNGPVPSGPGPSGLGLVNWNVGGAKYLALPREAGAAFRRELNTEIGALCARWRPDVVLLQEVVRTEAPGSAPIELIDPPAGYRYVMAPIHDSAHQSHPVRWQRYREGGGRAEDVRIAQGSGFLWREDLRLASLWDYGPGEVQDTPPVEVVPIETGLFTGDRDTEPRAAAVTHFVARAAAGLPVHIFVANVHLSTLHGERADHPARDRLGTDVRLRQLNTVLEGIVARHVGWSQLIEPAVDLSRVVWVVGGDFNVAPEAPEIERMNAFGFSDASPNKGRGNKTSGFGNPPTHTVDYLFVNYLESWHHHRRAFEQAAARNPEPDLSCRTSDHYPTVARVPLAGAGRLAAVR